jgi:hypothetical protein
MVERRDAAAGQGIGGWAPDRRQVRGSRRRHIGAVRRDELFRRSRFPRLPQEAIEDPHVEPGKGHADTDRAPVTNDGLGSGLLGQDRANLVVGQRELHALTVFRYRCNALVPHEERDHAEVGAFLDLGELERTLTQLGQRRHAAETTHRFATNRRPSHNAGSMIDVVDPRPDLLAITNATERPK